MFTDLILYSIKDTVTGCFSDIKMFVNEAQAKRWFDTFCAESKISSDLQLFSLGQYNALTGDIFPSVSFVKNGGAVNA